MATRTTKPKENKFGAMGASAQAAKAETPTEPVAAKAPAKTRAPRKTPAKAKAPAKPKAAAAAAVEDAKTGGPTPKNRDKKLSTYVTYDTWVALQQRKLEESREGTRTVNDIVNDAIEMYLRTKV